MGCASSKRLETAVAVDAYRLPPTSIAIFDISKIEEPWLLNAANTDDKDIDQEKKAATALTLPILEKLDSYELAPQSWSEVSKALEDLKPSLGKLPSKVLSLPTPAVNKQSQPSKPEKAKSFHKLEELESKISSPSKKKPAEISTPVLPSPAKEPGVYRPVQDNSFITRDRQERERQQKGGAEAPKWKRRDPFEGLQEKLPPGNAHGVVLYTTTLRGVRRTFEACEQARQIVEQHAVDTGIQVDERDVSLHTDYLKEVKELIGEGATPPRLFVAGKYVGCIEQVVELGDTGRLREMFRWVARRGGTGIDGGRRACEGCGGARFVPCLVCNGSRKVIGDDLKTVVRCGECNENGLVLCPGCH